MPIWRCNASSRGSLGGAMAAVRGSCFGGGWRGPRLFRCIGGVRRVRGARSAASGAFARLYMHVLCTLRNPRIPGFRGFRGFRECKMVAVHTPPPIWGVPWHPSPH